jgi:BirA family transcriptional regulator, biotin operon repressor / biotin---[acetyl-CoA-carboxylase] ligase
VSDGAREAVRRPFDPERFEELVAARGLAWGHPFHYASETASTNDLALEAAREGGESGSVFLADHQTRGRGRRGKTWLAAPAQNLLFSILLCPRDSAPLVAALTLAVGLGVRDALAPSSRTALRVKWPNDVLAAERKVAGILCEGLFERQRLVAVVIGIGINVYGEPPPELASSSIGLEALAPPGVSLQREQILADVLASVEAHVTACLKGGFAALLSAFSAHDALAGERVEISGASPTVGTARGVDAEGRLLVETEDGIVVPVLSGTVRCLALPDRPR